MITTYFLQYKFHILNKQVQIICKKFLVFRPLGGMLLFIWSHLYADLLYLGRIYITPKVQRIILWKHTVIIGVYTKEILFVIDNDFWDVPGGKLLLRYTHTI